MLYELRARDRTGSMIPYLRLMDPFALEAERHRTVPFLLIEDPQLFDNSGDLPYRVNRVAWKNGQYARVQSGPSDVYARGEPLVIYTGNIAGEARSRMAQACILDFQDNPEQSAFIWLNTLKDVTISKHDHISNHPFYLRRYARRVASLCEKEYGPRPLVNATTAVSLNRRPYQPIVAPDLDLASVPVTWFGHNVWIKDLQTPRIPRETLVAQPSN